MIATSRATLADAERLAPLFDAYRTFYRQRPDVAAARVFLTERLRRDESVIFLASAAADEQVCGFTQLYRSFSSVSACRVWILNDLYVIPSFRRRGVARALMEQARRFAIRSHAERLVLETEDTNTHAQHLYESLGYQLETGTRHYSLDINHTKQ